MNEKGPLDLLLLQTFTEVARAGSVTRAAERLGRSQPAVSHRLRALERDLGVRLFEKVGRRLQLSEYGRRLERECLDLMARSRHLRERVLGLRADREGRVTIGSLPTITSHLLVPALKDLLERHPRVALSFRFGYVPSLCERLRSGELDVLLIIGALEDPGLEVVHVGATSLVAATAPALAPEDGAAISPEELRARRYLAFGGEPDPTFDRIERYAEAERLANSCTPRVPHIETLRELAAAGAGYTLIPEYTARRDRERGRLVLLRPEGLEDRLPISMVGRVGQVCGPALEVVRAAFAEPGFLDV